MPNITVILEVDDEESDPDHDTGLTEEAYEQLMVALPYTVVDIRRGGE